MYILKCLGDEVRSSFRLGQRHSQVRDVCPNVATTTRLRQRFQVSGRRDWRQLTERSTKPATQRR